MYKLWVNVNETGTIISTYGGHEKYIGTPLEPYDYYFYVSFEVFQDIQSYTVINSELIMRAE